jgi:hypothetical protein
MSFPVIESKAGFNSAETELLAVASEFVFRLVGAFVHATAKLTTAANETSAWIRFFIWWFLDSVVGVGQMCSMRKRGHKSNPTEMFIRGVTTDK